MVQFNPELAKSSPSDSSQPQSNGGISGARPGSVYSTHSSSPRDSYYPSASRHASISSRHSILQTGSPLPYPGTIGEDFDGEAGLGGDGDDDLPVGFHFTFIPPNPRKYYKRLLECCLTADLEAMLSPSVGDDDEVSLGILSGPHIELINECALRWRIGQPYRAACFLEIVKGFYERNEVPLECVPEALQTIGKVMNEIELEKWPVVDVSFSFFVFLYTPSTFPRQPSFRWFMFRFFFFFCFACLLCLGWDFDVFFFWFLPWLHFGLARIFVSNLQWTLQHLPLQPLPRNGPHSQSQTIVCRSLPSYPRRYPAEQPLNEL